MKILVPIEVLEGTNSMKLECTMSNEDEMRISHIYRNKQDIERYERMWKLFEELCNNL